MRQMPQIPCQMTSEMTREMARRMMEQHALGRRQTVRALIAVFYPHPAVVSGVKPHVNPGAATLCQ